MNEILIILGGGAVLFALGMLAGWLPGRMRRHRIERETWAAARRFYHAKQQS